MTARQIASLSLKLIGIYLLLYFLTQFMGLLLAYSDEFGRNIHNLDILKISKYGMFTLVPVTYIGICIYMIIHSDTLAERMVDEQQNLTLAPGLNGLEIQSIAFSCIGLILITRSVSHAVTFIGFLVYPNGSQRILVNIAANFLINGGLGLALFLQGKGLARFWQTLRS